MRKFTVFTLILTVVVIVVVAEIVVNEYLPTLSTDTSADLEFTLPKNLDIGKSAETNVLGGIDSGLTNKLGADSETGSVVSGGDNGFGDSGSDEPVPSDFPITPKDFTVEEISAPPQVIVDFEDANFSSNTTNVYLRDEQIKSAGFVGAYIGREASDDHLFKTIFVDDLYDTEMDKNIIRTSDTLLAKVYIFKIGPDSDTDEVYQLLKLRATEGLNTEVNETNEFGSNSFYMNDSTRANTVFLTVRIGSLIYGFSYPKEYHSQIKNLIQLLQWEFS